MGKRPASVGLFLNDDSAVSCEVDYLEAFIEYDDDITTGLGCRTKPEKSFQSPHSWVFCENYNTYGVNDKK
jgi:hypothetical protein